MDGTTTVVIGVMLRLNLRVVDPVLVLKVLKNVLHFALTIVSTLAKDQRQLRTSSRARTIPASITGLVCRGTATFEGYEEFAGGRVLFGGGYGGGENAGG